ncbi:MAG: ankyrin repeat domain-containing protein, partial [Gammaproteobacteria bacterium]|nr:ankyrin repeat domain-containing protein [Gammaproteobacteria bacterium]
MWFYSHAKRMQHPQARLIPEGMWSYYFTSEDISDTQITLMQTEVSDLDAYLDRMASQNFSEVERKRAWLLIALSHPNLPDGRLIHFFRKLKLDTALQLQLTAVFGRISLLESLFKANQDNLRALVASDTYAVFKSAAVGGHLDALNLLIDKLTELAPGDVHAMIAAGDYVGNYAAFRWAACGGHLDVLNWLIEKQTALAPDKVHTMIASDDYAGFRLAARGGHLDVLNWLIELQASLAPGGVKAMIIAENYRSPIAFIWAARNGQLDVLKWLIEQQASLAPGGVKAMIEADHYAAFMHAAFSGHLDVLNWLIDKLTELSPDDVQAMIASNRYTAFREAARNSHRAVTNRLLQISSVFAYAEQHEREYGERFVYPFIHEHMHALREARTVFEAD